MRLFTICALLALACTAPLAQEAPKALVDLDARDPSAGLATWRNQGALGPFLQVGHPRIVTVGGVRAVAFDGVQDAYRGPLSVPAIEGNAPRTIAVWAYNPSVDSDEETLVSWGRRGGPNGTTMSFNWGRSPEYGAATHWAEDLGWKGTPRPRQWHYLVYTYDGKTARVYDNGVEKNARRILLNTVPGASIELAVQNDADGNLQFRNGGSQLAGSVALAFIQILPAALTADQIARNFEADAQRFGATRPIHILQQPQDKFTAGSMTLTLLKQTQIPISLSPGDEKIDFLPGDRLAERAEDGCCHLGDITLRVRIGDGAWKSYESASDRERLVPISVAGALAAGDLTACLGVDCPLTVTREWRSEQGHLALRFRLVNHTRQPVEIGALGAPMVFNNILTDRSLEEAHQKCVFADPYIGGDGGYLQVTRLSGEGPVLLVLPETGTSFEAYRPLHDDPTPRGVTFEGFYEWMAHTGAYAENEWKRAEPWNRPTTRLLPPGQAAVYGFEFVPAPSLREIEPTLITHKRPVVIGIPGYVLPSDQTGRLFIKSPQAIQSLSVEPAGAMRLQPDSGLTLHGWHGYSVVGVKTGRCRLTITYADGLRQSVHYNVLLPEAEQVRHLGRFHAENQWYADPADPFHRTFSFMPYDREHNTIVLERENSWPVGLSDEMGAGASVAMAMKNLGQPDAHEVALLEKYADGTLWGQLQNPDYSVKASLFYYDPQALPDYRYSVHGGWDKPRGETTWRAYNYPHVAAVYWALYHLARDHQGLVKTRPWDWYLDHAYHTAMAMRQFAGGLAQFGLMVGSVFLEIMRDLRREGWNDKADLLEGYMKGREQHWAGLRYPFGSEMPWDSTGQEEIYTWCKTFGDDNKAQVTLNAITAYMPAVPNWAYNGAARRYFDESVNNTRWPDIMRITNHYGSGLNAIPPLDAYKRHPDDFYLLRIGYAGMDQLLANIDASGFGSGDFDTDPAILKFDPFTSDYGIGFYGYARNAGAYVVQHPEFGWLCFGGDVDSIGKGDIRVTPRDGFRKRVFLAPLNLWLTLDAGTFESVAFHPGSRLVRIVLSPARPGTSLALLRIGQAAGGDIPTRFAPVPPRAPVRGAYTIQLTAKATTLNLNGGD